MDKNKLQLISRKLGSYPAIIWGGLYLITIVIFSIIYSCLSAGFYHSTSQFEESLISDEVLIKKELAATFKRSAASFNNKYLKFLGELKEESIEVSFLDSENDKFKFFVNLSFKSQGVNRNHRFELYYIPSRPIMLICDSKVYMINEFREDLYQDSNCTTERILYSDDPILADRGFTIPLSPGGFFRFIRSIEIPYRLELKVLSYVNAKRGFPNEANGNYGRMLYLSVVTITTLGYGDIVPTTGLNRFLVGLESIIGLTLVGLFLNSLAYVRSRKL